MMNPKIQFTKIRNVKTPQRAHPTDAGTDFFIPEYDKEFLQDLIIKNANNRIYYHITFDENKEINGLEIIIPAGEQVNIPSGIKVWIEDKNTYLEATNKSGIAANFHLSVMANTIDANYQGEVHLNVANVGNSTITIKSGQKIVQMIHKQFINTEWNEITNDEYKNIGTSDRADGGFSSTKLY